MEIKRLSRRSLQNVSSDSLTDCLSPDHGRISNSLSTFSLVYGILSLLLMASGIILWYKHKDQIYLKRRSFELCLLMCIGWLGNIISGPFFRSGLNDKDSVITNCFLANLAFFTSFSFVAIPQVVRLYLFYNRIKFNRRVAELFKFANEIDDEESDAYSTNRSTYSPERLSSNKAMKKMKFKASWKFGLVVCISSMTLVFVLGVVFGLLNCRTALSPDVSECVYLDFINWEAAFLPSIPLVVSMIFHFYFLMKTIGEPDPFRLVLEIKLSYVPVVGIGVTGMLLTLTDPGDLQKQTPFNWKWTLLNDFAYTAFFLYTFHYQIYLAVKRHKNFPKGEFSLKTVLENRTGATLFERHLVDEFSVDNLTCMKEIEKWKDMYGKVKTEVSIKEAERIYERSIKQGAFLQANISSATIAEIANFFENDTAEMVSNNLFDNAYSEVFRLLEHDSFTRFRRSPLFKQYTGQEEVTLDNVQTYLYDDL